MSEDKKFVWVLIEDTNVAKDDEEWFAGPRKRVSVFSTFEKAREKCNG